MKELGLTETVSTRLLVDAAKLIVTGLSKRLAVKVAIIRPLTDDLEIIDALSDVLQLIDMIMDLDEIIFSGNLSNIFNHERRTRAADKNVVG